MHGLFKLLLKQKKTNRCLKKFQSLKLVPEEKWPEDTLEFLVRGAYHLTTPKHHPTVVGLCLFDDQDH